VRISSERHVAERIVGAGVKRGVGLHLGRLTLIDERRDVCLRRF
jgi:hypothetical protein